MVEVRLRVRMSEVLITYYSVVIMADRLSLSRAGGGVGGSPKPEMQVAPACMWISKLDSANPVSWSNTTDTLMDNTTQV